jgi:glycerophosphoryl diester phosphodiesterase
MREQRRRPALIAHRGESAHAPENTLAAFERAIHEGADWIELDLQLSADGQVVVFHDERLDRLCNAKGSVRELDAELLAHVFVLPQSFGQSDENRIPLLSEVLRRIGARIPLYLEMKAEARPERDRILLEQCLSHVHPSAPHVLASFDLDLVRQCLERERAAVLIADDLDPFEGLTGQERSKLHALSLRADQVDRHARDAVDEAQIELWAWTVDEHPLFERLLQIGVDGICTNDVARMRRWVEEVAAE